MRRTRPTVGRGSRELRCVIQAVTAEQVSAAFRKHIDPKGVAIVKAGDFNAAGVYK